jgi:hypothetical protein
MSEKRKQRSVAVAALWVSIVTLALFTVSQGFIIAPAALEHLGYGVEQVEDVGEVGLQALSPTRFREIYVQHDAEVAGTLTSAGITDSGTVQAEQLTSTDDATVTDELDVGGNITLENDETLSNATDGVVQVGGQLAFTEGTAISVTESATITPTGSFQPLISASAIASATLANGSVAGQVLALTNENASDNIVILESTNLKAGGNVQLDGGNDDGILLLWTGGEWIKLAAFGDN